MGPLSNWLGVHIWLSLVGPKSEVRTKHEGACQLLIKSWPLGAGCHWGYYFAFWNVVRDGILTSCKCDLETPGLAFRTGNYREWVSYLG